MIPTSASPVTNPVAQQALVLGRHTLCLVDGFGHTPPGRPPTKMVADNFNGRYIPSATANTGNRSTA